MLEGSIPDGIDLCSIDGPRCIRDSLSGSLYIFLAVRSLRINGLCSFQGSDSLNIVVGGIFTFIETNLLGCDGLGECLVVLSGGRCEGLLGSQIAHLRVLHILEAQPADVGTIDSESDIEVTILDKALSGQFLGIAVGVLGGIGEGHDLTAIHLQRDTVVASIVASLVVHDTHEGCDAIQAILQTCHCSADGIVSQLLIVGDPVLQERCLHAGRTYGITLHRPEVADQHIIRACPSAGDEGNRSRCGGHTPASNVECALEVIGFCG